MRTLRSDRASSKGYIVRWVEAPSNKLLTRICGFLSHGHRIIHRESKTDPVSKRWIRSV